MKLTEKHLKWLIDTLNAPTCEDGLLVQSELQDMVRAIAAYPNCFGEEGQGS